MFRTAARATRATKGARFYSQKSTHEKAVEQAKQLGEKGKEYGGKALEEGKKWAEKGVKMVGPMGERASAYVGPMAERVSTLAGPVAERVSTLAGPLAQRVSALAGPQFATASAVVKHVYRAEQLSPKPLLNADIWKNAAQEIVALSRSSWTALKARQVPFTARAAVIAVEAWGIYKVGEIIGRRSLVGYNLH
ncbi:hypothetical protein CPB85DRAFT_226919 [Mucidula mucida]|nr:hypothetical protein CPB85DRAFT_226919 [Mucidula mucida]